MTEWYAKFFAACMDETQSLIPPSYAEAKEKYYADFTSEEKRCYHLIMAVYGVDDAIKNLKQSVRYIEVCSQRPPDINAYEHIRYHYHAYLQYVFILRERMKLVLPTIYKVENRWVAKSLGKKNHETLRTYLDSQLAALTELRRAIVHEAAPYHDSDLSYAELFSILRHGPNGEEFADRYQDSVETLKLFKKWYLKAQTEKILQIVNHFFKPLCAAFLIDNKLSLPTDSDTSYHEFSVSRPDK